MKVEKSTDQTQVQVTLVTLQTPKMKNQFLL